MKQNTHWMPLHTGEFLAETSNINTIQIGAYTLLLIHYWHKRGLPADDRQLARISKTTVRGWQHMKPFIAPLFGPNWTHLRLDKELSQRDLLTAQRAAAGSKGGNRTAFNNFQKCDQKSHKIEVTKSLYDNITKGPNPLKPFKRH